MAICLATHFKTVIISADSRQCYKEMSIGTAKPDQFEREAITHYFIDSHQITDDFSAGDFEREALALLKKLFATYDQIVLVGGSGLFVDALCHGLDDLPKAAPGIREKWNDHFKTEGLVFLQKELQKVDPDYFEKVDTQNPQRLIRALEVFESTGLPFSHYRQNIKKERPFDIVKIGLEMDRDHLYQRINDRVEDMIAAGLVEEVQSLLPYQNYSALRTVGYAEIFDFLADKWNLDTAIDKVKQNTRRYAKRQLTWFKKDPQTAWFHPDQKSEILAFLNQELRTKKN